MRIDARLALLLSGALLTLSLVAASPAAAATCTVKNPPAPGANNFATIQAAVAAPNCSLINVKPGTYAGPISINRNLVLRGASSDTTTINLAGNTVDPLEAIIAVVAPATTVTIEKFTIAGPGASGCGSLLYGILVRDGATATIKNNHITAIRDNPLSGCQNGNAIQVGRNLLGTTGHAVIENNTIDDYQKTGIIVDGLGRSRIHRDHQGQRGDRRRQRRLLPGLPVQSHRGAERDPDQPGRRRHDQQQHSH